MGVGGPENLGPIRELARVLGAPLATTRDCCDKGWLPRQHQVGLTGRAIAPRLYFAIGIRGAFEHTVGIGKAGLVVAINSDHRALIWECSDLGLEDDWNSVVPALSAALSR
jgi:electron transfer flavoprotein alpha subunit